MVETWLVDRKDVGDIEKVALHIKQVVKLKVKVEAEANKKLAYYFLFISTASRRQPPVYALAGEAQLRPRKLDGVGMRRKEASRLGRALSIATLKESLRDSTDSITELLRTGGCFI